MSSIKNYNTLIKQNRTPESNEAASPDIKNSKDTKNEEDKEAEKTEPETGINKWYKKYNKELFLGLAIILCIEIFTTYKNNLTGVSHISYTRKGNDTTTINMKGGGLKKWAGKKLYKMSEKRKEKKAERKVENKKEKATIRAEDRAAKRASKREGKGGSGSSSPPSQQGAPPGGDAASGISYYIIIGGLIITFFVFIFCLATPSIIIIGSIVLCYYSIKMQLPQLMKMSNKMGAKTDDKIGDNMDIKTTT
jgi:hypothetical protein